MTASYQTLVDGMRFQVEGRHEQALSCLLASLESRPDHAAAWLAAGRSLVGLGALGEALVANRRAMALQPTWGATWLAVGDVLRRLGLCERALPSLERAVALEPDRDTGWLALGEARVELGDLVGAEAAFTQALQTPRPRVDAVAGLARVRLGRGQAQSAARLLAPVANAGVPRTEAALAWSEVCGQLKDPEAARGPAERALRDPECVWDRVRLLHTLGNTAEALGDVHTAFDLHRRANAARGLRFDADGLRAATDARVTVFGRAALSDLWRPPAAAQVPVLVVGAPFSGTERVAALLSAQTNVANPGRVDTLRALAATLMAGVSRHGIRAALSGPIVREGARAYGERLARGSDGARFVVDATATNYRHLWLAATLAPNVRVVRCTRDPAEVAWESFRQALPSEQAWAASVDGVAAVIAEEERIMAHWRATLDVPTLTVDYHDARSHPEALQRRLQAFLTDDQDATVVPLARPAPPGQDPLIAAYFRGALTAARRGTPSRNLGERLGCCTTPPWDSASRSAAS